MASMSSFAPARKMWVTSVAATAMATAAPYISPKLVELAQQYEQIAAYVNGPSVNALLVLVASWIVGYFTPPSAKDIAVEA